MSSFISKKKRRVLSRIVAGSAFNASNHRTAGLDQLSEIPYVQPSRTIMYKHRWRQKAAPKGPDGTYTAEQTKNLRKMLLNRELKQASKNSKATVTMPKLSIE